MKVLKITPMRKQLRIMKSLLLDRPGAVYALLADTAENKMWNPLKELLIK